MPAPRTETAVAFTVREKFSWTLASLKRLYAFAGAPFTLYIVDGYYPAPVQAELDAFLAGRENVVRITAERYLYPSEALNAVVERISEPYLFLVQNDVLIGRDTLKSLLETAKEVGCDVVAPLVLDTDNGAPAVHRDVDKPLIFCEDGGRIYVTRGGEPERRRGRRRAYFFEMHCLFMRTDAARAVCPLPPLSVHEHFDLGIALWRMGKEAFLDHRARVLYMDTPPLPLRDFEVPYFRFRWDPARARQSDQYVRSKWRIADLYDGMSFIARQFTALRPEAILTRYDSALEADTWPEEIPGA
jgi:GT2 family glycosyltransferase